MVFDHKNEQPPTPHPEVELEEWFSPFVNYGKRPYTYNRSDYSHKTFPFYVRSLDLDLEIALEWADEEQKDNHHAALVITPQGKELTTVEKIRDLEGKYETKLLVVSVIPADEHLRGQNLAYQVELRYQNDILQSRFNTLEEKMKPYSGGSSWQMPNTKGEISLYVAEIESVLSQLEMRIVPAETAPNTKL